MTQHTLENLGDQQQQQHHHHHLKSLKIAPHEVVWQIIKEESCISTAATARQSAPKHSQCTDMAIPFRNFVVLAIEQVFQHNVNPVELMYSALPIF
jgi:hypothetical protein